MNELQWLTPGGCAGSNCLQAAERDDGQIALRNSQRPGEVITVSRDELRTFTEGARAGELDSLIR